MDNNKNSKNNSFIIILGIVTLAFIAIFVTYYFYRTSLNPITNVNSTENEEVSTEETKSYSLNIDNYNQTTENLTPESVIDRDLKLKKSAEEKDKRVSSNGNLELTDELIFTYKNSIMQALYLKEYDRAVDYANEVIENYDFSSDDFITFESFLYEVLELKDYSTWGFESKKEFLKDLVSPEIILFVYLTMETKEQYDVTVSKQSNMVFTNPVYGVNLIYNTSCNAGLYSEINIGQVFFPIPNNIENGYQIQFKLDNVNYRLYYIRYSDTNNIDIISVRNMDDTNAVTFENYYKVYNQD